MSEPTIRVLSEGAGVQSTVLTLMAADGTLPGLDCAVFADPGWESRSTYEHLDKLEKVLTDAGIPLYRVGRGGGIRDDVLDRRVFATIPAFTLIEREERKPLEWHFCTCEWAAIHKAGHADAVSGVADQCVGATIDDLEAAAEELEVEDGDDHYSHRIWGAADALRAAGLTQVPPAHADCHYGQVVTKWYIYTLKEPGRIKRQCTGKYKVEPVERKIRELLGASVREVECRFCGGTGKRIAPWDIPAGPGPCSVCRATGVRRLVGSPPKSAIAEQWIGFSTDEMQRVSTNGFPPHAKPRFPLIELGMSRDDCIAWLAERGWSVAKSACLGCPFGTNSQWREMRDNRPDEWADAVEFDRAFRNAPGLNGQRFLHPSMLPLDQAPIDRLNSKELGRTQLSIFDVLAEEGDPDGCSPYGCISGEPVGETS